MTGILIAAIIIGLIILVGGFALFMLLPVLFAIVGVIGLVLVMAVVAILMVPNFITLDDFKPDIINMLKQATGREIAIGGPIGFTVWPVLGLQLRDISVGNPKGSDDPIMLAAQELGVGVTLSSLMDHRLELRELRVVGGQINLATDARGRGNWNFKPTDGEATSADSLESATATADSGGEKPGEAEQFTIKDIQIEKIEIVRTNISYDPHAGEPIDLDNINLAVTMPSLDKPLNVTGSVNLRQTEVKLAGTVDMPRAIMDGKETPVDMTLSLGGDQVKINGTMQGTAFKGNLTAAVSNLTRLASWASGTATAVPFTSLSLSTGIDANATRANLTDLAIKLDDMTISGKGSANWAGARPRLVADVNVSAIDLDKFTASGSAATPAQSSAASNAAPDLSALDKLNADITARLAGLTTKGVQLGSTTATVTINNGRLQAAITPASLSEGTLAVKADVSAAGRGGRTFNANVDMKGVQMGPLLVQFAGSDRLTGKGDLTLALSGPVAATETIKRELNGNGNFAFRDGAIKGVNIPAMIRNAKAMLSRQQQVAETGPVQTDFTELTGSFRINSGVVTNNDLKMLSPLVRVSGRGMASIPASTADYRIEAVLVADLAGQGGTANRNGLVIPVNVRGPFSNLKYEPDLQGLVLGNIGAARDVGAAIQELGTKEGQRNARDSIKNLLGLPGRQQQAAPETAPAAAEEAPAAEAPATPAAPPPPPAPADVLRGLLNR